MVFSNTKFSQSVRTNAVFENVIREIYLDKNGNPVT